MKIQTNSHGAPGTSVGGEKPDARLAVERRNRAGSRSGGLVDQALCVARIPLPLSYHAGSGISSPLGSRIAGRGLRRAQRGF